MVTENVGIVIVKVKADEMNNLISLYVDIFQDREPLTKWLGYSKKQMVSVAMSLYGDTNNNPVIQGMSWFAREQAGSNNEVGFIVCDDPGIVRDKSIPDIMSIDDQEKISYLMRVLEEIRSPIKQYIMMGEGKCFHVSAVGVAPGYEGKGIGKKLLQEALADARKRGFSYAFSECTSLASRILHEKLDFTIRNTVRLESLQMNGSHNDGGTSVEVYLMWKELD
ncbi:MAG: N-acetyltransferase family protein [Candidatus Woesearchaeota archaeon]